MVEAGETEIPSQRVNHTAKHADWGRCCPNDRLGCKRRRHYLFIGMNDVKSVNTVIANNVPGGVSRKLRDDDPGIFYLVITNSLRVYTTR